MSEEPDLGLEDPLIAMCDKYTHKELINNVSAVKIATEQTLRDFEADGVVHCEIRTTPRAFEQTNMSKDNYVDTIVGVIERHNIQSTKMKAYLILSIDRRNTVAEADEVVDLALKYQSRGVIGVDLCGDSLCGDISIFKPSYARAKEHGLHITLHFGEEPSCVPELMTLLSYNPTRLGHLLFISDEAREEIIRRKLGIELCLTSNIKGPHIPSYEKHHLPQWLKEDCPIALCTDNAGVNDTPGSTEYFLASKYFSLSYFRLWKIAMSGVDATFVSDAEKKALRSKFVEWKEGPGSRWIK
ncbi:Adenosine deaminase [Hyphodiscus hymeniophilus]|uniref:Adenosine deaminase n=1 Tax=Hyphodiscus hymeniophilus TaxID=353542 RepID=A0A9P7AV13_9HELO|nr:Adenosine deaminase [Hyphodiscus hymeniophilus]